MELALRLKNGDRSALAEAYRRWADLIYTTACTALPATEHDTAADVTAEAFLKIWENRSQLQVNDYTLPAWIVGAAHRVIHERGEARRAALADHPEAEQADLAEERARLESTRAFVVAEALTHLAPTRARVMQGAFVELLPFTVLGEELNLSAEAVRYHLRRGMTFVRRCVQEADHVPA